MTLPPCDGVNQRYHLIHKVETPAVVLEHADICIADILSGTARVNNNGIPVVCNHLGTPFLPEQLLSRYLQSLLTSHFSYEKAVLFCEKLMGLIPWNTIAYQLQKFVEANVQNRYFDVKPRNDWMTVFPVCTLKPESTENGFDKDLLRFTCYVAICHTLYGSSCETLTTQHYLGLVKEIYPAMVKELKEKGSGKLSAQVQKVKNDCMTASANDAFALIRITVKNDTELAYEQALRYLCAVLEEKDFPESYSVIFKGPEKQYLPIRGLPKKGIHQLFACAVRFPSLFPLIRRYAKLAMRESALYHNMRDSLCVMPGTFAVFALGIASSEYWPLVREYLALCDDEHSSLQEKFMKALIEKYGFTSQTVPLFIHAVLSMQGFQGSKALRKAMENSESLAAFIHVKKHMKDYLTGSRKRKNRFVKTVWQDVLYGIWGVKALQNPSKIVKQAPKNLQAIYQRLLLGE